MDGKKWQSSSSSGGGGGVNSERRRRSGTRFPNKNSSPVNILRGGRRGWNSDECQLLRVRMSHFARGGSGNQQQQVSGGGGRFLHPQVGGVVETEVTGSDLITTTATDWELIRSQQQHQIMMMMMMTQQQQLHQQQDFNSVGDNNNDDDEFRNLNSQQQINNLAQSPPPIIIQPNLNEHNPQEDPNPVLFFEAKTTNGITYFYNPVTKLTSWVRPVGPGVKVVPLQLLLEPPSPTNPTTNQHYAFQSGYCTTTNAAAAAVVVPSPTPTIYPTPAPTLLNYLPPPLFFLPPPPAFNAPSHQQQLINSTTTIPGIVPPSSSPLINILLNTTPPPPPPVEWTEHISPDGISYFYNSKTNESVWKKPESSFPSLLVAVPDDTTTTTTTQQNNMPNESIETTNNDNYNKKWKDTITKPTNNTPHHRRRPISVTPVPGTPWCIVWTSDFRVFYHKPSIKCSTWQRPLELIGRKDVDVLISSKKPELRTTAIIIPPATEGGRLDLKKETDVPPVTSLVEKAEATSTTTAKKNNEEDNSVVDVNLSTSPMMIHDSYLQNNNSSPSSSSSMEKEDIHSSPPTKKKAKVAAAAAAAASEDQIEAIESKNSASSGNNKKEKIIDPTKKSETDSPAAAAAATLLNDEDHHHQEPLEVRQNKFRELLIEKKVSAFSTWQQELRKIVFDPRYSLLPSKERKIAFDEYVVERADGEKAERMEMIKQTKNRFMGFLSKIQDRYHPNKLSCNEFLQMYSRNKHVTAVENFKDRTAYFREHEAEIDRKTRKETTSVTTTTRDVEKNKQTAALEERARDVQNTLRDPIREWEREREKLRYRDAIQSYEYLLEGLVKPKSVWKNVKRAAKMDKSWEQISIIERDKMYEMFVACVEEKAKRYDNKRKFQEEGEEEK